MTDVVKAIEETTQAIDPNAPITKAAVALGSTIAAPTPEAIVADVMLAIDLVKDVKAKLGNSHPTIMDIFKALL